MGDGVTYEEIAVLTRNLTPHQVTLWLDDIAYDVRKAGLPHQADELIHLAGRLGQFTNVTYAEVQASREAAERMPWASPEAKAEWRERLAKGATT